MLRGFRVSALGLLPAVLLWTACVDSDAADLVLRGGKVATVDSEFSIHQAIAVKDGRIIFVGADDGVEQLVGRRTRVIELDGKLVTPGMVDAHGHPFNLGNVDEPETFSWLRQLGRSCRAGCGEDRNDGTGRVAHRWWVVPG